jgi:hypothetical protein
MRTATAVALAAVGGVIALGFIPRQSRHRLSSLAGQRMLKHLEHMMASLPEELHPNW